MGKLKEIRRRYHLLNQDLTIQKTMTCTRHDLNMNLLPGQEWCEAERGADASLIKYERRGDNLVAVAKAAALPDKSEARINARGVEMSWSLQAEAVIGFARAIQEQMPGFEMPALMQKIIDTDKSIRERIV